MLLNKSLETFNFNQNNIASLLAQISENCIKRHHAVRCHHIQLYTFSFRISTSEYLILFLFKYLSTCQSLSATKLKISKDTVQFVSFGSKTILNFRAPITL